MQIKCLAQGSTGNCWILEHDGHRLIIDAGVSHKQLFKGIDYDLLNISGAVISHEHRDHSLAADQLNAYGVLVFEPYNSFGLLHRRFECFDIKAFSVEHDGTPCYGFLITVNKKKLLYITDFEFCKYSFIKQKVNYLIVECNYQMKYLEESAENMKHKVLGHCELETCKKFIEDSVSTDALQNVILTHLGASTCNGEEIVEEVSKIVPTGVQVDYARANETYILGD